MTHIRTPQRRALRFGAILAVGLTSLGLSAPAFASAAHDPSTGLRPRDPGPGQTERIAFASGTDNATVTGVVSPGQEDHFVLRAGAGQTMSIQLGFDALRGSVGVFAPDGTELSVQPNPGFEGVLPATGDYVVTVHIEGDTSADFPYTLSVRIPAGPPSSCGATQRIRFAPGTDHAMVSGTFCEGADNRFLLRAGAGQTMTVSGIEAGTAFSVVAPDGTQLPGGPGETISYQLPTTGDYTIIHGPRRSEVSSFEFAVTIPPLGGPPAPTRVQFPAGTFGTSLHDSVAGGSIDRFVLWAGAGHRMAVHIDAAADNAWLTIKAPDGAVLSEGETQPLIDLPATGDYVVEVHTTGDAATYQISFWIR